MSHIIDGKQIALQIAEDLKNADGNWKKKAIAAFMVGEDRLSESFLLEKQRFAERIGIEFRIFRFSDELSNDQLRKKVGRTIRSSKFGGGIVQLPLPDSFNEQSILNVIPKEKDIDCLSEQALGGFYTNRWIITPPSVGVTKKILERASFDLIEKKVVLIGRGRLIGKPILVWLLDKTKDVSVVYVKDIGHEYFESADLIICGAGISGAIKGKFLKKNVGIIDFGYSYKNGTAKGDVDFDSCRAKVSFITPTPSGTGPMVVAELFNNFYTLNQKEK